MKFYVKFFPPIYQVTLNLHVRWDLNSQPSNYWTYAYAKTHIISGLQINWGMPLT